MKIKGLDRLIKSRIDEESTTQELYGRKLGVSVSTVKSLINGGEVVKIDLLIELEKQFGDELKDLLKKNPNGQKINDLVFNEDSPHYGLSGNNIASLEELLLEMEKQTELLKKILNKL